MADAAIPVVFLVFARTNIERYTDLPRLADEARSLRKLFDAAEREDRCQLVLRENATLDDLLDVFQDSRYAGRIAVFHFAGHADAYSLLLEGEDRQPLLVDAGGFAGFLGEQKGLQLVFLNACSTLPRVAGLRDAGIPAVIATKEDLPDEWALPFAVRCYTGLVGGASVEAAFNMAQDALRSGDQDGKLDPSLWGLYASDRLGLAWTLVKQPRPGQAWQDDALPHAKTIRIETPPPPPVFVGRQPELLELYRWLDEVRTGTAGDRGPRGRLGLVYGQRGLGKRELVRQWLADLRQHKQRPITASTTFQTEDVAELAQAEFYSTHPLWRLDWERFSKDLSRFFPAAFKIGRYPFLALAAQLAAQSERVQAALAAGERWDAGLHGDAPEALARRAVTEILRLAAGEGRPIVLVIEQFHRAPDLWLTLLQAWEEEIRRTRLPVLLLVTYDYPQLLTKPDPEEKPADTLAWLRRLCTAPLDYARSLFVPRLTPWEVELLLAPESAAAAVDLYSLTEGIPAIIEQLLEHWAQIGDAEQLDDGRWLLARSLDYAVPGRLYEALVTQPLQESAERAQALGYAVSAGDLLEWLNYAAWEGDIFTDEALARAVGWYDGAYEQFEEVLDEGLCGDIAAEDGLAAQVDWLELPAGDNKTRVLTRYKLNPPLVGRVLRQRQDASQRLQYGHAYGQALEAAYAPFHERVDGALAALYQAIGLTGVAASYRLRRQVWDDLEALEQTLPLAEAMAQDDLGRQRLLELILQYALKAHLYRHGIIVLEWLFKALPLSRKVGDKYGEAATLTGIGAVYSALGDNQQALAYYEQALPLSREVGDKRSQAETLHGIGAVYSDLGNNQQAMAHLEQALPLSREVGDKRGEAVTLHGIGAVYSALGDKQVALVYYEQALPLSRQVGDKDGEAKTLNNIGAVYAELGDHRVALEYLEQALPLSREVGNKHGEAATLANIGAIYDDLGENQKSLAYLEQALPLSREVGDKHGEAAIIHNIGADSTDLGDMQKALAYYEQALALRHQIDNKHSEAETLHNIGAVYADLGDKQKALEYYEQALALSRQVGDKRGNARTLTGIGAVYADLGDKQNALAYCEQALPLMRQVGDKRGEAKTLYGMGAVYANLGDQQVALVYYEQALPLSHRAGDKRGEAKILYGMGGVYSDLGDQRKALAYLEQALPLRRAVGDKRGEAETLRKIDEINAALGRQPEQ